MEVNHPARYLHCNIQTLIPPLLVSIGINNRRTEKTIKAAAINVHQKQCRKKRNITQPNKLSNVLVLSNQMINLGFMSR